MNHTQSETGQAGWIHWTPARERHGGFESSNLGDRVIRDSVNTEVEDLLGCAASHEFSTKEPLGKSQIETAAQHRVVVVGGSNLLCSHMFPTPLGKPIPVLGIYRQWKLQHDGTQYRPMNIVLMAAGWWKYQRKPDPFTAKLLRNTLNGRGLMHSVRDEYTRKMLLGAGVENVVNTGCSTMWRLHGLSDSDVNVKKSDGVICTVTDYRKDPETDKRWLSLLREHYGRVILWLQGSKDRQYLESMGLEGIELFDGDDSAYSSLLKETSLDYIGTRLHGGIRSLQQKRSALIFAVDNRATEISKSTGLRVSDRADLDSIRKWILGDRGFRIAMPVEVIDKWRLSLQRYFDQG